MSEVDQLRDELKTVTAERNKYHAELTDLKLAQLRADVDDHEKRLRIVEIITTRSNVLYALATGGGLISIITLIQTFSSNAP